MRSEHGGTDEEGDDRHAGRPAGRPARFFTHLRARFGASLAFFDRFAFGGGSGMACFFAAFGMVAALRKGKRRKDVGRVC